MVTRDFGYERARTWIACSEIRTSPSPPKSSTIDLAHEAALRSSSKAASRDQASGRTPPSERPSLDSSLELAVAHLPPPRSVSGPNQQQ
jgi:hypothetical protein